MTEIVQTIAKELSLREFQVANTIELLDEECTIPFIARYRKERTGSLDEVQLRNLRDRYRYLTDLEETKVKYLKVVEEHCQKREDLKGKFPALKAKFLACSTKQELEDLYLPFKPKRRTRAQAAREKGLQPLADKILAEAPSLTDLNAAAQAFVSAEDAPAETKVANVEEALAGAQDILAEQIAETAEYRALVRRISHQTGALVAKKNEAALKKEVASPVAANPAAPAKKGKDKKEKLADKFAKYENYFDYREPLDQAAAHRVMAVRRGEGEKVLRVTIEVDAEQIVADLTDKLKQAHAPNDHVATWLTQVVEDAYKRLLAPSIETELRLELKTRAEQEAIRVFSKNLENLLLLPPVPEKIVMGIDPGIRTGSKLAVVSPTGKVLAYDTIYPLFDKSDAPKTKAAKLTILNMVKQHDVQYIAIGNGTGGREISRLVVDVMKDNDLKDVKRLFVNEAGASVYSTDEIAREEFPDLDPTIRSAISIARRLQDPLAELVKIDPRSIGVGQYQHDVNVNRLKNSLEEVVESCVNRVGVNLNSASYSLLSYVSGVSKALAKSIVTWRDQQGVFGARQQLFDVAGFGPKVFTQAAGFLRISNGENPLDNSAVHPESYDLVQRIAKDRNCDISELVGNQTIVETIPFEEYVTDQVGMPTLKDIAAELIKPGRDPRADGHLLEYSDDITELEDLKVDMELQGTVTNVTNFGAFVDIGVHQDGLVHISELSQQFVKDPSLVVSVGDIVKVRVIDVDLQRRRISLSCRPKGAPAAQQRRDQGDRPAPSRGQGAHRGGPNQGGGAKRGGQQHRGGGRGPRQPQKNYTMDDLLKKFNSK